MNFKIPKKRKTLRSWDDDGERVLVDIWRINIAEWQNPEEHSLILQDMVCLLQDHGYKYSKSDIRAQMKNMTVRFHKEKQEISQGAPPSDWEVYEDMEVLLKLCNNGNEVNFTDNGNLNAKIESCDSTTKESPVLASSSTSLKTSEPNEAEAEPSHHPCKRARLDNTTSDSETDSDEDSSDYSEDEEDANVIPQPVGTNESAEPARTYDFQAMSPTTRNALLLETFEKIERKIESITKNLNRNFEKITEIEDEKSDILESYADEDAVMQPSPDE